MNVWLTDPTDPLLSPTNITRKLAKFGPQNMKFLSKTPNKSRTPSSGNIFAHFGNLKTEKCASINRDFTVGHVTPNSQSAPTCLMKTE